jgi:hypothetical protein
MKDFIITTLAVLGIVAIILVVITTVNNVSLRPSVVLTSEACDAPCWYGIQPGVTNSQNAYDILKEIDVIPTNSIKEEYDRDGNVTSWYWFFQRPAPDGGGTVYFSDDRATAISLLTANSLKLEELIEKFGEPNQYWGEIGYGENREYLEVSLFYPVKGIVASLVIDIEGESKQVEIKDSSRIMRVTFFEPNLLDDLLETRILIDTPKWTRTGSFNPWSGYGTVSYDLE